MGIAINNQLVASSSVDDTLMGALETTDLREREFLHTVYEMTGRCAKRSIAFVDAQVGSGHTEDEADQACDFWADRGVLEFTSLGRIALTYIGLRRATRLAERGWRPQIPF